MHIAAWSHRMRARAHDTPLTRPLTCPITRPLTPLRCDPSEALADGTPNYTGAAALLRAAERIGAKLRAYMLVRTLVSVATGLVVWAFAKVMGLELAAEWGAIALVLNYIPFLGPLVVSGNTVAGRELRNILIFNGKFLVCACKGTESLFFLFRTLVT